jgi:hypothetical protein
MEYRPKQARIRILITSTKEKDGLFSVGDTGPSSLHKILTARAKDAKWTSSCNNPNREYHPHSLKTLPGGG